MNALEFQFHILPIYPLSTWAITVQPSIEFLYSNSMVDRLIRAVVLIDSHCNSKEISIASGHLRLHVELPFSSMDFLRLRVSGENHQYSFLAFRGDQHPLPFECMAHF